ncbi:MAG: class I SAM-dependent methyltransferase [Streptosporangiaceae bacterium]
MSNQVIIEKDGGRVRNVLGNVPRMFRYFTASPETKVRSFYEMLDRRLTSKSDYRDIMGIKQLYVNMGYWEPGCADHDEASEKLAEQLGAAAGISAGDRVLDVGFGYGEQDLFWLQTRNPAQIVGLNVSPSQVRVARDRAAELKLEDRLDMRVGSGTSLPFQDASFDVVVALESAVHFDTRQRFFEEALRVLRPGGVLATADMLPNPARRGRRSVLERLDDWRRSQIIPDANWHSRAVYAERLALAGFADVDVRDITDRVLLPQAEFVRGRCTQALSRTEFNSAKNRRGMNLFIKLSDLRAASREYVIAVARKPR